ncbi:MAG: hypothetical protein JNJ88_00355 [Planctomycetes bacterium]|nr:hypothetical protein [Planctomycetota bacterium]
MSNPATPGAGCDAAVALAAAGLQAAPNGTAAAWRRAALRRGADLGGPN